MLADILHSLANDTNDSDGVAELVVTALGSSGQHYICWKTHCGEYKQQSNGLPKKLQDWLFPADGSTRDFETLQVILSGEDTFWASDRNGEVRNEPSGSQKQMHRRALTLTSESLSAVTKRRTSRTRELSIGGGTERPRSSTLPSISPTADHSYEPRPTSPASHSRSSPAEKFRRVALVPLAFHQQRRSWATRPRSLVHGHEDLGVLKEQPSPLQVNNPPTPAKSSIPVRAARVSDDHCACGRRVDSSTRAQRLSSNAPTKPRPSYADAGVQTEPTPEPEPEPTNTDAFPSHRRKKSDHHYRRESASSVASTADSFNPSYLSSKRSSFETVTTQPDPGECYLDSGRKHGGGWQQQHWVLPVNPVRMGRMQDYFRSSTYVLGAALQS